MRIEPNTRQITGLFNAVSVIHPDGTVLPLVVFPDRLTAETFLLIHGLTPPDHPDDPWVTDLFGTLPRNSPLWPALFGDGHHRHAVGANLHVTTHKIGEPANTTIPTGP